MCGIFCSLRFKESKFNDVNPDIKKLLQRRGPDNDNCIKIQLCNWNLLFFSCVLHMQGSSVCLQPASSMEGNILLYTGDVFAGIEVSEDESDTAILLELLEKCSTTEEFKNVLTSVEGPWSIIYFQKSTKTLWFGRDYFGRRSLLFSPISNGLLLSSVAIRPNNCSNPWLEIPTGLHCINLDNVDPSKITIDMVPWLSITTNQPKIDFPNLDYFSIRGESFLLSPIEKHKLSNESDIRVTALNEVKNLDPLSQLVSACDNKMLWPHCKKLLEILERAVSRRTRTLNSWKGSSKVGVLFSGGLDCTILAWLADKVLPQNEPIDLLNVAFEQIKPVKNFDETLKYNVPDRITGFNSCKELEKLCPNRQWNFIKINVTIEELKKNRSDHIADLTYPKQTVLDDSIGCAIWFASRGKGFVVKKDFETPYTSTARILLCGMGADEQLGGYSRHRNVFHKTSDWSAVDDEIEMEIDRISCRNLGRDDRIVSDHGREARFPYLDEEVVGFLSSLPVHKKADFRFPRGVGEKIVLRGAAYLLGLRESAVLPKRAIQFGSRIAKVESPREKGSDTCSRLVT